MKILFVFFFFLSSSLLYSKDGHIDFPASTNNDLQQLFVKGVIELHNFSYNEAAKTFLEIEKKYPDFPLAYWGEAMSYNHPLWNEQDLEKGRAALNKLAKTPEERIAKGKNPQERGFIKSVNLLYGEGTKKERDLAYTYALKNLYEQFPMDNEIALFYALALLGKEEGVRDYATYMEAASVAADVFKRNPYHPGAAHYLIHSVDDPIHAPLGLEAARVYATISPDAPHAAHMPSHIYFALGMWKDANTANERAFKSDPKDKHVIEWLHYGYLQTGQFDKAYDLLKKGYELALEKPDPFYDRMRAAHYIVTEEWNLDLPLMKNQRESPFEQAYDLMTMGFLKANKHQDIDPIIQQLQTLLENSKDKKNQSYKLIEIFLLELQALKQKNAGQIQEAEDTLKQAISLENELHFEVGPSMPPKPSRELLADLLFENKQWMEACKLYKEEVKDFPNRSNAINKLVKIKEIDSRCVPHEYLFFNRFLKF